jgi:nicotinate-nucleotide adenylyltransferase
MNLGIFGGTFDPVHLGHLILAETVREECGLDELWFMPARLPPHKQSSRISPPQARIEMLELAIAGHENFRVSDLEIQRESLSFTVETLRELRRDRPDVELSLLIGADSLADFPTWKEPEEILKLARVIAVNRGREPADLKGTLERLDGNTAERFQIVSMPAIDLSASEIRNRCAAGKSIRYRVPRPVELYIRQHGLYERE